MIQHSAGGRPPTTAPSETDIAWAAGLFEGEGCIHLTKRAGDAGRRAVMLSLRMTDEDVVERFIQIVGIGRARPYPPDQMNRKPGWQWSTQAYTDVRRITDMLRPYLGRRRTSTLDTALTQATPPRGPATKANGRHRVCTL